MKAKKEIWQKIYRQRENFSISSANRSDQYNDFNVFNFRFNNRSNFYRLSSNFFSLFNYDSNSSYSTNQYFQFWQEYSSSNQDQQEDDQVVSSALQLQLQALSTQLLIESDYSNQSNAFTFNRSTYTSYEINQYQNRSYQDQRRTSFQSSNRSANKSQVAYQKEEIRDISSDDSKNYSEKLVFQDQEHDQQSNQNHLDESENFHAESVKLIEQDHRYFYHQREINDLVDAEFVETFKNFICRHCHNFFCSRNKLHAHLRVIICQNRKSFSTKLFVFAHTV